MNLVTLNYDILAVISAFFLASAAYLMFGHAPRQWRTNRRDMTKISKTELRSLYQQIEALKSQIDMLQTAPIKKESTGQLRFDVAAEDKTRVKKFPHDRLVTVGDVSIDVYVKSGKGYVAKYKLPVGTPVNIVQKDGQFGLLNKSLFVDGRPDLPNLYLHENDVQIESGYDVWALNDWNRYQDGKRLVRRGRSRMWINDEEMQRGDIELEAFKWEAV